MPVDLYPVPIIMMLTATISIYADSTKVNTNKMLLTDFEPKYHSLERVEYPIRSPTAQRQKNRFVPCNGHDNSGKEMHLGREAIPDDRTRPNGSSV